MSDIGLNFSVWDIFAYGAIIALPLTTILLVICVIGRLRTRQGRRPGLRWILNAGIIAVAPMWATGTGLLLSLWIDGMIEESRAAGRHFVLKAERTIDGVALPAGSEVTLNGYGRLKTVNLPA